MMFDFSRLNKDKPLHYRNKTTVETNPDDYYWLRDTGFYKLWIQEHIPSAEFNIGANDDPFLATVAFKQQRDLCWFELAKPTLDQIIKWGYNKV